MTRKVFVPIDGEIVRRYTFATVDGEYLIEIEYPLELHVSESGGHRVIAASGVSHYIPAGWIHLCWETKPGFDKYPF